MAVASDSSRAPKVSSANSVLVVDIGKKPKKQIKELREGRGKLMDEVTRVIEELRSAGSISAAAEPVVVVVKQKRKARPLTWPFA